MASISLSHAAGLSEIHDKVALVAPTLEPVHGSVHSSPDLV